MNKQNCQNLYGPKSGVQTVKADKSSKSDSPSNSSTKKETRSKRLASRMNGSARANHATCSQAWDFDTIPQKPVYPDNLPDDNIEAALYLMNKE